VQAFGRLKLVDLGHALAHVQDSKAHPEDNLEKPTDTSYLPRGCMCVQICPPAFQILRVDHELVPAFLEASLTDFSFNCFLPPVTINSSVPLAEDQGHEHEAKVQSMEVSPTGEAHLQPSAMNPVRAVPQSGT